MWIIWFFIICIAIVLYVQFKHRQKLLSLAELFRLQNYPFQAKNPLFDDVNIGYIYGMARSLSSNIAKSKKYFLELANIIYGSDKSNQAMLALLEYSTYEETKKKMFVKAAQTAIDDVRNMSDFLSFHDPLNKSSSIKMPDGLSRLYKEQKKK